MTMYNNVIGRREYVSLPEFNLKNIVAKIDTGAYSGCINASHVKEFGHDGHKVLQFELSKVTFQTIHYRAKKVRHANGVSSTRYVIKTILNIAGKKIETEIGLSNRANMLNPVLIGRKILEGNFLVDVSAEFLASNKN